MYSKNFTKTDWQKYNDGGYYIVITDHNIKKPTCNVFYRNGQEVFGLGLRYCQIMMLKLESIFYLMAKL